MEPSTPSLQRARRIVLEHVAGRRVKVYLFGSRARGDAAPTSDVDLAVLPEEDVPPRFMSDLREALAESDVPFEVDVVDLRTAAATLRTRVEREGVLWAG